MDEKVDELKRHFVVFSVSSSSQINPAGFKTESRNSVFDEPPQEQSGG